MNRFLKKNKLWLSLLAMGFVIVLLAFIFRPKSINYKISATASLKSIADQSLQVSATEITDHQIIDLRSAELFAKGHPEFAVNIPVRQLLDDESLELFDKLLEIKKEVVLCGSDELQAAAPCLLLRQLGYTNVKHLSGGMSETGELKAPELASIEVSVIDTAVMRTKTEVKKAAEVAPVKKKPEAIIPVRKVVESGGGC
jgi:rhodanese-related sulfurtransferase